jgi:hypothetical protein
MSLFHFVTESAPSQSVTVKTGETHTASLVVFGSCTASLNQREFNASTQGDKALPVPESQQSCCTAHSYPSCSPLSLCYIPVGQTQRVHAEDFRHTSYVHLAVSQCYGIDLCVMCHAFSRMPGRESETFEARAKATVRPSIATSLMSFCLYWSRRY